MAKVDPISNAMLARKTLPKEPTVWSRGIVVTVQAAWAEISLSALAMKRFPSQEFIRHGRQGGG